MGNHCMGRPSSPSLAAAVDLRPPAVRPVAGRMCWAQQPCRAQRARRAAQRGCAWLQARPGGPRHPQQRLWTSQDRRPGRPQTCPGGRPAESPETLSVGPRAAPHRRPHLGARQSCVNMGTCCCALVVPWISRGRLDSPKAEFMAHRAAGMACNACSQR